MKVKPGLFGQNHNNSSRDYTKPKVWGKNQFNSSFPASLIAYMSYKGIEPVYLWVDENNDIIHKNISGTELFGINPLSENAFYNFEAGYSAFEKYYTGDRETIDLVMMDSSNNEDLIGLEIKLTALPDNTTRKKTEDKYSCEIVVRPPTICFLACTICRNYEGAEGRNKLKALIDKVPKINHWEEVESVLPHYAQIRDAVLSVSLDMQDKQVPLMIQVIWKTKEEQTILSDDCLDAFVWSNLAIIQMFCRQESKTEITSLMRSSIWLYNALLEYSTFGQFDYDSIFKKLSYGKPHEKAYTLSGCSSYNILSCCELTHPRINKNEIKNIILGGGQRFLNRDSFDTILSRTPNLFDM